MNIDNLIKREAPNNDTHDRAYAKHLRGAYESFSGLSRDDLLERQEFWGDKYRHNNANHVCTATCVVIYELLKESE